MTETKATLLSKGLGNTSFSFTTDIVHVDLLNNMPCFISLWCVCSSALAYGLVCLAMAYLASLMGSVLQVTSSSKNCFHLELRHIVKYVFKDMFCKNFFNDS